MARRVRQSPLGRKFSKTRFESAHVGARRLATYRTRMSSSAIAIEREVRLCSDLSKPFADDAGTRIAAAILKHNSPPEFDNASRFWSITVQARSFLRHAPWRRFKGAARVCWPVRLPTGATECHLLGAPCQRVQARRSAAERLMLWHMQRMGGWLPE